MRLKFYNIFSCVVLVIVLSSCIKQNTETIYKLNAPIVQHYTLNISANHNYRKIGFKYNEIILATDTNTFYNNIDKTRGDIQNFELDFDNHSYIYLNSTVRQKGWRNISVLNCNLIDNGDSYELKLFVDTKRTSNKTCIQLFNFLKCNKLQSKPITLNIVYDYQIFRN
jgi:hypothetical protein